MRRLLLFLLLFAAGLSVLLLVQELLRRESPAPHAPDVSETETQGPETPEVFAEVPDEGVSRGYAVKAPLTLRHLRQDGVGKGNREWVFSAQGLRPVIAAEGDPEAAGAYDAFDVHIELWDPVTKTLETQLDAMETRVRLRADEDNMPRLDESHANTLVGVDVLAHEGLPLAPLRAHIPLMELRLSNRRITSSSDVLLEGSGVRATGRGLVLEEASSSFRLLANADVHLRLEDGTRAELSSRGALEVLTREDLGTEHVSISAKDGAHLDLRGGDPMGLDADRILLLGRASERDASVKEARVRSLPRAARRSDRLH